MKSLFALTFVCLCLISPEAGSVPAEAGAESQLAPRTAGTERLESRRRIVGKISDVFGVPISFESSYVNEDRSSVEHPKTSFTIQKGETLAGVLDRFCASTRGQFQWARIRDTLCVWPTGTGGTMESLLDTRLTLNIQGASTWHAFVELARAVNANVSGDRYLRPYVPIQDEFLPFEALRDEKVVSLALNHVTAREAACAIVAASPLRVEFKYHNNYRPGLSNSRPAAEIALWVYDEDHKVLFGEARRVTGREMQIWSDEARSVIPPLPKPPLPKP